jgi:hypothetical protein
MRSVKSKAIVTLKAATAYALRTLIVVSFTPVAAAPPVGAM